MNCKEFFNRRAATWDQNVHHDISKINLLLDMLGIYKGCRILDIGCGTGVLVPHLIERVGTEGFIAGVDISERMIEIAREKFEYPNLSFTVGDIHNIRLEEQYHIAVCYSVFPHLEDRRKALLNIRSLLCSQGKLAIMHSQSRTQINSLHSHIGQGMEKHLLPPAAEVERLMVECGMHPLISIDNEDIYLVMGQKKDA